MDTIRSAQVDGAAYPNNEYGIPLTNAEYRELLRRSGVQMAVGPAVEEARRQPGFAGAYLDQLANGMPVFLFTDDPGQHVSRLMSTLPASTEFRVEGAEWTEAELYAIQDRLIARWRELEAGGININSVGIVDPANAVQVGVEGLTPAIEARLQKEFGPGLIFREQRAVVEDACINVHDCRPIKGGLEIRSQYNDGECTSGFVVRRFSTHTWYLLTAGHCIAANGGYDKKWEHNPISGTSNAFGWSRYETWVAGGQQTADVGLMTISSDEVPSKKNEIYVGGGGNVRTVVDATTIQLVGGQALMYGQAGGYYQGTITRRGVTNDSPIPNGTVMMVTATNEVSFNPISGDSGGPVFYMSPEGGVKRIALGTHVHSDPGGEAESGDGWYSQWDHGRYNYTTMHGIDWDYMICTTASC